MPAFRKGMWEFTRTSSADKTPPLTTKECTNPGDDMKKQNTILKKAGCSVSPFTKRGTSYTFTTRCSMPGVSMHSKSVISVESDSAYSVKLESRQGGKSSKEFLVARRTGDC